MKNIFKKRMKKQVDENDTSQVKNLLKKIILWFASTFSPEFKRKTTLFY